MTFNTPQQAIQAAREALAAAHDLLADASEPVNSNTFREIDQLTLQYQKAVGHYMRLQNRPGRNQEREHSRKELVKKAPAPAPPRKPPLGTPIK